MVTAQVYIRTHEDATWARDRETADQMAWMHPAVQLHLFRAHPSGFLRNLGRMSREKSIGLLFAEPEQNPWLGTVSRVAGSSF